MFMDGGRRIFERETLKPKNLSETLGRFARYFRPYWLGLVLALGISIKLGWLPAVGYRGFSYHHYLEKPLQQTEKAHYVWPPQISTCP